MPPLSYVDDPKRKRMIYIFECGEFIKVGIATDIARRQEQIEMLNPYPVRLAFFRAVNFSLARAAEKAIHAELAPFRHRGEWFKMSARAAHGVLVKAWREALKAERRMATARKRWEREPGGNYA
jgi:hypothetical protein